VNKNILFWEYFKEWVALYKEGAIRQVTLGKYHLTLKRLTEIAPILKLKDLDKRTYQGLINEYAKTHERATTMDWHHHLKSCILDAMDEGYIKVDPTRKVIIKGKPPSTTKKPKFLSHQELQTLLGALDLRFNYEPVKSLNGKEYIAAHWDWLLLVIAKTGLRFAEVLGLTSDDIDLENRIIRVNKTWNYKGGGGFTETKNKSSVRTILIDDGLASQLSKLMSTFPDPSTPIFVRGRVFNSIVNLHLQTVCERAGVPIISVHSLRHTHASVLLHAGVSIASIAKRLGHANTTTTQEVYLHIIKELEVKDNTKIVEAITALGGDDIHVRQAI